MSYLPLAAGVVAAALVAAAVDALVAVFGTIEIGTNTVYSNLAIQENEDVIRFRFQPNAKKLVIDLVRIRKSPNETPVPHSKFKNGINYEIAMEDNVYYCPVVQSVLHDAKKAHLIT